MRVDKTMAYAGSLLQLNRGESLGDHGLLFWNVKDKSYTRHYIENDYGYLKVRIRNGELDKESLQSHTNLMPKFPRFSCGLIQTTFSEFEQVKNEIETTYGAVEITLDNRLKASHGLKSVATRHEEIRRTGLEEEVELI